VVIVLSSASNVCTMVCMIDNDTIEKYKSKRWKVVFEDRSRVIEYKKMQTSNTHTHSCVCRHVIQPILIPLLSYLSILYTAFQTA
jgi:hypothetical protein